MPSEYETAAIRVLVVDDDVLLLRAVSRGLRRGGFHTLLARSYSEALNCWVSDYYAGAIVDWKLDECSRGSGLTLAKQLRQLSSGIGLIMMSGYARQRDIIAALETADDYLIKPFSVAELVARTRAVTRRTLFAPSAPNVVRLDYTTFVDLQRGALVTPDRTLPLARAEMELLKCFQDQRGSWLTTAELALLTLARSDRHGAVLVWQYLARLKKKLNGTCLTIEHVRGKGYRLR